MILYMTRPHEVAQEVQPVDTQLSLAIGSEPTGLVGFRQRIGETIGGYRNWAERYPFAATAVETTALFAARHVARKLAGKAGLHVGNASADRHLDMAAEHPVISLVHGSILGPLAEELVFRKVLDAPAKRAETNGQTNVARGVRIITTLGFAAGHAGLVRPPKRWQNSSLDITSGHNTVPIDPLVGGMNYERLNRTRGFGHAVLAHSLNNALVAASATPEVLRRRSRKR